MSVKTILCLVFITIVIFINKAAFSQETIIKLQRINNTPRIDGNVTDSEWQSVKPLPLTEYEPVYKGKPTEKTELRIAYDDNYIYVAGKMFDSDPDGIRMNSLYRDLYSGDDDISIAIDTYNDNRNALWFFATPAGVRVDWAISNDADANTNCFNSSWNTYWDVSTIVNNKGWFAEMRIPFSSLGFRPVNGKVIMGISVYRYIARKNEREMFPDIKPDWTYGFVKPSKLQDVELDGIVEDHPAYLTPYVLGGFNQNAQLNGNSTSYLKNNDYSKEVGFDLKYDLTSNLTLNLTANTDFAQVEADDQQINLSRYSLFFPEKRQFFQERSSIFDFDLGFPDQLFYSRRIGLNNGKPVRILGGARLVGKIADWDVGFIDMQTEKQDALPSQNFGVLRLKKQVLNENSYLGGMITSKVGINDQHNTAYGIDGRIKVVDDNYFSFNWVQTYFNGMSNNGIRKPLDNSLYRLHLQRLSNEGFYYQAFVERGGENYYPDMGFSLRHDFTEAFLYLKYGKTFDENSAFKRITPGTYGDFNFRNSDHSLQDFEAVQNWRFEFKNGALFFIGLAYDIQDLRSPLLFDASTNVPAGNYKFLNVNIWYNSPDGDLLRNYISTRIGKFYDGSRFNLNIQPTWNISPNFELGFTYDLNLVRFSDRNQKLDSHIARLHLRAAANTKLSATTFIQYNSNNKQISLNARLRYNFSEGNDLWIVYNDGLNIDRYRTQPILPVSSSRAIIVKYLYTFKI